MARTRWLGADGSTVSLLLTGATSLRVDGRSYTLNYDTDGDSAFDAIAVSTSYASTAQRIDYGIFIDDPDIPNRTGTTHDDFVVVYDRSRMRRANDEALTDYGTRPTAYLGSSGRDAVTLHAGDDLASGGSGNDILAGGFGDDMLYGGIGKDHLDGGSGNDLLDGGAGRDQLTGGGGSDRFVFTAGTLADRDMVTDFSHADGDKIDLGAFAGLTFIGDTAFSGTAGEIRVRTFDDHVALVFDLDGDRILDGGIIFMGQIALDASDLTLAASI